MRTATRPAARSAAEHRAAAQAARQRSAESFARCDTDGFVSQFAADLTAREHDMAADLIDAGGTVDVPALFHLDGRVASTHKGWGRYGAYWVLDDEAAAAHGKRFLSESRANSAAKRDAAHARKGFAVGTVRVAAYVRVVGGGTGFSGLGSCYPAVLASVDALRAGDYVVVATSGGDTD